MRQINITTSKQSLITTNVRIPQDELLTYREFALSEGKSFSQLVRDILAQAIFPSNIKYVCNKRSFWDIGKYAVKSGDPKASQNIDKCVYNI